VTEEEGEGAAAPAPRGWVFHRVAEEEAGRTVREILTGPLGLSNRRLQRLTRTRGIRVNDGAGHLSRRVRSGDRVAARAGDPAGSSLEPRPLPLRILHEDPDLLVVEKPAGVAVHPSRGSGGVSLVEGLAHRDRKRGVSASLHPVHRLDQGTSGLLLVARTPVAHAALDQQLRSGGIRRRYLALVAGVPQPPEGRVEAPIGRAPDGRGRRRVTPGGAPAATTYRIEAVGTGPGGGPTALLELELETGRTHQIRVHMAHLGHPVLGDRVYGRGAFLPRQALHAWRLTFRHPTSGEVMDFRSPLPPELEIPVTPLPPQPSG